MKTIKKRISVTVNGESYEREVAPAKSLLDFLRTDLNLTGTKEGCGEGECGACAVIINGRLVDSCLI
ncbi:MAG: 2Fe-2S iron-sulfur cluster binding domain-containing protein, partial [Deltaproteobacteria bacterium]|nr:2Fe-2S iron-sulfur cluster binding domain-containing protein [Deltaproteobacteria bacterium]